MNYFNNYEEFENSFKLVKQYYGAFMNDLSKVLNSVHKTTYSERYWEIIIGGWVWQYVVILYSNYRQKLQEEIELPRGKQEYYKEIINKNITISSNVFKYDLTKYLSMYIKSTKKKFSCRKRQQTKKSYITLNINKKTRNFDMDSFIYKDVAIQRSYKWMLDKKSMILLDSKVEENQITVLEEANIHKFKKSINIFLRRSIFLQKYRKDEFEYIFWESLINHFPIYFLEAYSEFADNIFDLYPQIRFKSIFVFNELFYENVVLNYFVAFQVEYFNAQLVGIQHGGGYGIKKYCVGEYFERKITDKFISWGWRKTNVIPMYSLLNIKWDKRRSGVKFLNHILYITSVNMDKISKLDDYYFSLCPDSYNNDIKTFLKTLLSNKIKITWRPYQSRMPNNDNENQINQVIESIDYNSKKYLKINLSGYSKAIIEETKLVVLDHCGTTLLETLANNIPTILFWNRDFEKLTKQGEKLIDKMENVGIFHRTPILAAEFILKINDNIDEWWESDLIQDVVEEFVYNYARQHDDIIGSYLNLLKKV